MKRLLVLLCLMGAYCLADTPANDESDEMNLRDVFAAHALQALITSGNPPHWVAGESKLIDYRARKAYQYADAMIGERNNVMDAVIAKRRELLEQEARKKGLK